MKNDKEILILTPCYAPNTGGAETHLTDYVDQLNLKKIKFTLLTLSPITTKSVKYKKEEFFSNGSKIKRFKFFSSNLYHTSEKFPLFNFLYIVPYFTFRVLIYFFFNNNKKFIIHSHGLNAGVTGTILKKIYKLKHILSTHAVYEISNNKIYNLFIKYILTNCNKIICVSKISSDQIKKILSENYDERVSIFTYWVDLNKFKPLNIEKKYDILFVGRLTEKKGIKIILSLVKTMSKVKFCIVGNGPEQKNVYEFSKKFKNLDYLGRIDNENIPSIYNASKIICIPSLYQEGYARVVLESLSCGIPIIATKFVSSHNEINNKNCIFLTDTDVESFRKQINEKLSNDKKLQIASNNARMHSEKHYSSKNFENIIKKIM